MFPATPCRERGIKARNALTEHVRGGTKIVYKAVVRGTNARKSANFLVRVRLEVNIDIEQQGECYS